jgi:hypothetical protein
MWIKPELADALIKGLPTLMIYKEGANDLETIR